MRLLPALSTLLLSLSVYSHDMGSMSMGPMTGNPAIDSYDSEDTLGPTLDDCAKTTGVQDTVDQAQVDVIFATVGSRGPRLHHALWHTVRSDLPLDQEQQVLTAFGPTWGQEHRYCPAPTADATAKDYNGVGEDFLFMHRLMVQDVRRALIAKGLKCISGWKTVADSEKWPKPDGDMTGPKSAETYTLLTEWDKWLQDDSKSGWLATHSLSQLGMAIELSTHNNLHMRFATTNPPAGFEGAAADGGAPIPFDGRFAKSWIYDRPGYNWLADPYGAAINPTFWKIHGYVDALLQKWLTVHGKTRASKKCDAKDEACYQWRGVWVGEMPGWHNSTAPAAGADRRFAKGGMSDTDKFNCERMRRQNIGVIGAIDRCSSTTVQPPKAGVPAKQEIPTDPFTYAVQAVGGCN